VAKTKEVVAELGLKKDSYTIMQVRAPQPRALRLRYCRHPPGASLTRHCRSRAPRPGAAG
jgi:hypothetical protein